MGCKMFYRITGLEHRSATDSPAEAIYTGSDDEMQLSCQHIFSQALGRRRLSLQQIFGVKTIAATPPSARSASVPALASCFRRPLVTGALIICAGYAASRAGIFIVFDYLYKVLELSHSRPTSKS